MLPLFAENYKTRKQDAFFTFPNKMLTLSQQYLLFLIYKKYFSHATIIGCFKTKVFSVMYRVIKLD